MQQVPSDPSTVALFGEFEAISPERLFDFLTKPELLVKWWPQQAESDLQVGGKFSYSWPDNNWILRGEFLSLEPGRHVSFTWQWDHEPVRHECQVVDIWIEPVLEKGSQIGLVHGKFDLTEADSQARQGVAEGWIHFGMRLAGLVDGWVE